MRGVTILLFASLVFLSACSDNEYDEQLKEAEDRLEEAKKETGRLESVSKQIDETSDLIEEAQKQIGLESDNEKSDEGKNAIDIEYDIRAVVDADLNNTTITELRINKDASVDEERYIALVDLGWDVQNSAGTTKEMLDMYSDHLAAKLADDELVYELVLFWTVPYHNENDSILKRTYENKDDGMYLTDEMKDVNVFD